MCFFGAITTSFYLTIDLACHECIFQVLNENARLKKTRSDYRSFLYFRTIGWLALQILFDQHIASDKCVLTVILQQTEEEVLFLVCIHCHQE